MYNLKSMKMNVAEFEALDVYACKASIKEKWGEGCYTFRLLWPNGK